MLAIVKGEGYTVGALLRSGADANFRDADQRTPLFLAIANGNFEICQMLIEQGSDVNAIGKGRWRPILLATHLQQHNILRALIRARADVNVQNDDGTSAIMMAAYHDDRESAQILIEANAGLSLKDLNGRTVLDIAHAKQSSAVFQLLTSRHENTGTDSSHRASSLPGNNRESSSSSQQEVQTGSLSSRQIYSCGVSITFAIAGESRLIFQFPNLSEKWVRKVKEKYRNVCFTQLDHAGSGRTNFLVVLSNSESAFQGLFPQYTTSSETKTTPFSGNGTLTNAYGFQWRYSYNGTVTTTTTTTSRNDLPYTDTTVGYFANAYDGAGTLVAWERQDKTTRSGGDPVNTLGYNLGSLLFKHNPKEKAVENIIKRLAR